MFFRVCFAILLVVGILGSSIATAERVRAIKPAAGGGTNLPYTFPGGGDLQWVVQPGGWIQHQGNLPVFAQAANVTVNGNGPQGNFNRGTIDKQTGELICDGLQLGNVSLSRRVLLDREEGIVRYIDVFSNRNNQPQELAVMLQTSLNFGVNGGALVADPRNEETNIGWAVQTGAGPCAMEMWAGRGSKLAPQVNWNPGNSFVQVTYKLTVPANGQAALMHLHGVFPSQDAAQEYIQAVKEGKLLAGVPAEVRKLIANYRAAGFMLGDRELLRGETLDVIELRTGDQLRGTLQQPAYQLQTSFGDVTLPADRVVGIVTAGSFRPRQLIVTREGEIFGGFLKGETITLQLSSGQTTAVPLSQISRVGYRKRASEPEEIAFTKPVIVLRTGDRLAFEPPSQPVELATRFGKVSLPMDAFAMIDLQDADTGVHVATLADGSRFGGLLQTDQLTLKLAATGEAVTIPLGQVGVIQMRAEAPEPASDAPRLSLVGGDVLVASLVGDLKLDTAFDTLSVNADEIVSVSPLKESGFDVQVGLWDQTTVSGQLRDSVLRCRLAGDVTLAVPLPLLADYRQPNPRPSEAMSQSIRSIVADLSADDFQKREQAEAQLVTMGKVVVPTLKQLRDSQPLEAQQRIDSILRKVQDAK